MRLYQIYNIDLLEALRNRLIRCPLEFFILISGNPVFADDIAVAA